MAAARTTTRGLSPSDLERIKDALGAGRRPKVVFTEAAGQIAGQVGQIVKLTDPELGDEWVVVRFGQDELPFSPTDLIIAPRGTPGRRPAKAVETAQAPAPEPPAAMPVPRKEPTVTDSSTSTSPTSTSPVPTTVMSATEPAAGTVPAVTAAPAAKAAARRSGKPKAPATLTVTLAYADGEWSVAAQQGAKALAKPYTIRANEALKMVALLDVPGVQAAVEEIVAAAREQAESAALRLRAELAEIEARLAELSDTP